MKAWIVSVRYGDCCTLVHAETAGKAKSQACWDLDCEFMDVNAARLSGLDDKPITFQNAKEAGFQYTDDEGINDEDEDEYFLDEKYFTNSCTCEICKKGVNK